LPALVLKRQTKGYASPALSRFVMPIVSQAIDEIDRWQLVTRGYGDPAGLKDVFVRFSEGSQSTIGVVMRLLTAEELLRKIDGGPSGSRAVHRHASLPLVAQLADGLGALG